MPNFLPSLDPNTCLRFLSKINKTQNCWFWIACLYSEKGYGAFRLRGETKLAHRVSWELHCGSIPEGLWVLHKCDIKNCVNPDHLFLGTHRDNMQDAALKDRFERGNRHHNAKLTLEQVSEIRSLCSTKRYTHRALASQFGVSRQAITDVVNFTKWADKAVQLCR